MMQKSNPAVRVVAKISARVARLEGFAKGRGSQGQGAPDAALSVRVAEQPNVAGVPAGQVSSEGSLAPPST
jgi:hypothetical protein